jgi:hypothetical protein
MSRRRGSGNEDGITRTEDKGDFFLFDMGIHESFNLRFAVPIL